MVIGFDGSRAFVKNRTGTENYSYQLLKALAKIDKKNQYIVYLRPQYSSNGSEKFSPPKADRTINSWPSNFKFVEISWPRLWTQGGLALQTFKSNLDVLFVPSHTLPLIKVPGLKTVVTVHDLGSQYLPSMHQLKQRLYLSFMQKHQLKTATKIIAVSKATKEDLIRTIKINPDKISVVYEGFDENLFSAKGGSSFGRKNDIESNILKGLDNYFLFVGTVQPRKNLARLIQAFAKFSSKLPFGGPVVGSKGKINNKNQATNYQLPTTNFQLVIAGNRGWLSDEIYKLPKKLGIDLPAGRQGIGVKFLGYVEDKDLPKLYSNAKAFLYPSLFEGFGLPILEAQACGCPVLTSKVSSMPEVGLSSVLYANPYDVNDIVKGMKKIMDKELRTRLVELGFKNVKRFSWEKCAQETLEVMRNVILND